MLQVQWSRSIPVRYEADIAVIGGGIAGVSAACAAAKSGAKIILVERFAVTGGNATTGGVAAFCGEMAGQGEIFDEIIADLEKWNAIAPYKPDPNGARVFDHHKMLCVSASPSSIAAEGILGEMLDIPEQMSKTIEGNIFL